jgi:glycosyltransferase involved in cell wall biosynthesis
MNNISLTFSVLISLFYKENPKYLNEALESIYNQILLPNEIIIVKEGILSNEMVSIINKWQNSNSNILLKIIDADKYNTIGLPACLNLGLQSCSFKYVARFDTDDFNLPDRFLKQIEFLKQNENIKLLGGQISEYNETMDKFLSFRKVPIGLKNIKKFSFWRNPFNHQTVIYERAAVLNLGGYPVVGSSEDYALWSKFLVAGYEVANLPNVLVKARTGSSFYTRRQGLKFLKGEIQSLKSQYNSNFYNRFEFILQIFVRIIVRIMPTKIIKILYPFFRKYKQ